MSTPALVAAKRAEARMAALLPRLLQTRREAARLHAEEARLLAEADRIASDWAAEEDPGARRAAQLPHRSIAAEIAAAWRVSDRTVQRQLDEAATLVQDFPDTHSALAAGEISAAHARIIVGAGTVIAQPELRRDFEASVLDYAKSESPSRLNPIAHRRAEWFADSTADERHRRARGGRRIWMEDLDDGMSALHLIGPAVLVHAAHDRVNQMARATDQTTRLCMSGEGAGAEARGSTASQDRTIDQLRADILLDLLLAADPVGHDTGLTAIHATVSITVPVLALIGEDVRDPFEEITLDGRSPIDAETARILAGDAAGWDRILTHPVTGAVLGVDRYRPSEEMRRALRVRDQHCRFPGCRMPTRRCDADHTLDFARGGSTAVENLAHLCRRHHSLKHQTSWTVVQRPGGLLEWTSPTGSTYTDRAVSTVAFAADPECEYEPAPF